MPQRVKLSNTLVKPTKNIQEGLTETVATNVPLYLSYLSDDHTDLANSSTGKQLCLYNPTVSTETVEVEDTMENPSSWQHIPVSPVIY